ncbi:MAG TPA: DUF3788 family protein [Rectinemataceae bacterium]|nr:DUF3788 family protein [Rectinemataceae bacterium]
MSDNRFLAEAPAPDPKSIAAALGDASSWYEGILEAATGFERDWKHYGKKYGWKLKIHDGAKALLELTIGARSLRLGLAVRERELGSLREDPLAAPLVATFLDGNEAKGGWGIRIEVENEARYAQALVLIRALAAIRKAG